MSLYLNIAGLRQGPGKILLWSWKSPGIFVTERAGTLISCAPNEPRIRWVLVFSVGGCTFCGTCGDNLAYPLRYTQSSVHYSQSSSTCLPLPSVSKLNVSHKMAAVMQPLSLYCSVATVL